MRKINLLLSIMTAFLYSACYVERSESDINAMSEPRPGIVAGEKYQEYGENPFVQAASQPVSTFSTDADGASYANMRRFLNLGQKPPVASVRVEEYINYFAYDYQEPADGENVGLESEIASCPWNPEHHLLRLGMKGKTIPASQLPNSNYVFLIDVSGSMAAPNKLELLKTGFKTLADNLRDRDRVAIVTYAGEVAVLLQSTYGQEKAQIKAAIDRLTPGGSTDGASGIRMAYDIAVENFIPDGNNRIILGTDGDFNVGVSSTAELVKLVKEKRDSGIYLTVLGVGDGNLNDAAMEQLADNGNGNYEYIDNARQINKVFTQELPKLYTVAKDCKIQVEFNPETVESYRLLGYENRKLGKDDFADDKADAGEIGASQTVTALYELVLKGGAGPQKYAQLDFRYKKPGETDSRLIRQSINGAPLPMESASQNMRFASAVAGWGLIMKQSRYRGTLTRQQVVEMAKKASGFDPGGYRQEFVGLVSGAN